MGTDIHGVFQRHNADKWEDIPSEGEVNGCWATEVHATRKTVPYQHWLAGLYPADSWEVVGYEFTGTSGIPTGVELEKRTGA